MIEKNVLQAEDKISIQSNEPKESRKGVRRNLCGNGDLRCLHEIVRNRTLTLIEREDDTRSWGNFLVYFSHSTTMSCPPKGWRYMLIDS
jgi:hypothetical protein